MKTRTRLPLLLGLAVAPITAADRTILLVDDHDVLIVVGWVGEQILQHAMIARAVGVKKGEDIRKPKPEWTRLLHEFSPISHVCKGRSANADLEPQTRSAPRRQRGQRDSSRDARDEIPRAGKARGRDVRSADRSNGSRRLADVRGIPAPSPQGPTVRTEMSPHFLTCDPRWSGILTEESPCV